MITDVRVASPSRKIAVTVLNCKAPFTCTTRGFAPVRNIPRAQIELTENNDDVETDTSPHRTAPHPVRPAVKVTLHLFD